MPDQTILFAGSVVPPPVGSKEFSLQTWDSIRNAGIPPQFHTGYGEDIEGRIDFLTGARMLGLELGEPGKFGTLQPQQLQLSDTLDIHHDAFAVEIPRRGSKTTSIFAKLLGRCARRPGYQVTFSAQSGKAGTRRLREWKTRLDAVRPPDDQDLPPWLRARGRQSTKREQRHLALFGDELVAEPDEDRRGFRILMGEVGKGIYFDNGSQFLVLQPNADDYRGEAADVSWLDEAQAIDLDEGPAIVAGIRPLQDTKPDSSIIVSGTAGEVRAGLFWQMIDALRASRGEVGGIDFAVPEDTPWELIENEATAMTLLRKVHPGIGTLTTIEKQIKNYRAPEFGLPQWAREYLSLWPETFGATAIPPEWVTRALLVKPKPMPARVAFGMDIRPGGSIGALAAAWRDSRGIAYVSIVEHQPGTSWMPKREQELSIKYRGSTIAYDAIGEQLATATETQRLRPKPRLRVQTYREHAAGCVQLLRDLERNKLRHFGHKGLLAAFAAASKREVRGENGIWLWAAGIDGADISPLVAATRALRNWDQHFAKSTGGTSTPIMGE